MKKLVQRSLLGVAVAATLLAATLTNAATTGNQQFSVLLPSAGTTWSGTFNVPQWGSTPIPGATLTAIDVWVSLDNPALNATFQTVSATAATINSFSGTMVGTTTLADGTTTIALTPAALAVSSYVVPGNSTYTTGSTPGTMTSTHQAVTGSWVPYIGGGTVGLGTVVGTSYSLIASGGPMLSSFTGNAGETFHIEYEYSAVPEASTCGVLAGLGCLVAFARRLRR